ncbi:MAG: protein kinase domain-containing protein [Gaiellaceae bacterium]
MIADRYELEALAGTGGMSSVYRARDRMLERHVALKILHDYHGADEETIERFRREARAVAQLSHPNIVTVIDRGEENERQFIVFEYIDGESLKELVERNGPLPVRRALELAIEVAGALAFAHDHGLVHRDVKPQNVLLNGEGRPKVTDFGIARSLDVDGMTQTGTVLGTSNYIAPEQATGNPVGPQTDVYSLGVVLFELLTGEVPFPGESFVAVAMRHVNEPAPSALDRRPDVPVRVALAIERALEKDPADRFASMDEFMAELRACLDERGPEPGLDSTAIIPGRAARESRPRRARPRRSVWPTALLTLGLALLAAIVVAVLVVRGTDGGEAPAGSTPIRLVGVGSFDPPPGDGQEHPEAVGRATDRNPGTYWTTERYNDFSQTKDGVGLVLDAGKSVRAEQLTLSSSTPGFTARIDAGPEAGGPFDPVTDEQTVGTSTTFELEETEARYFVVWITELPEGVARITEVEAR